MTQADQWAQINYPSFFGAIGDKITAAVQAMASIPVNVDANVWLITNVNEVPIKWQNQGDFCRVQVGEKDQDQSPIVDMTIPYQWLAA